MEAWLHPIFDAEGMRAVDSWAIEQRGVPSLELMEAAGRAVADASANIAREGPIRVVCGKGNNGGDGLVAARLLAETGFEAEVLLLWPADELSGDAAENLGRLGAGVAREVEPDELAAMLQGSGAVVDAIFGTGFEGAPREPADVAIAAINDCGVPVIACDLASGVNAANGEVDGAAVEADLTVSFHVAKLGQLIAPGKKHTGDLLVAPIGIPDGAPQRPAAGVIGEAVLRLAPPRGAGSTKFSSGQVLIAGGARGLSGAVCMSAEAAIRAGAGYATAAVAENVQPVIATKLTEVMSIACPQGDRLTPAAADPIAEASERAAAVVLGPGLGRDEASLELARALPGRIDAPLVIDADGLNAHSGRLGDLRGRGAPTVLTPHEGELGRLLECESAEISAHRLARAREAAEASGAIVVLKGDDTIVTDGERVAIKALPSPSLATAGTGDVLSGLTAALLARFEDPFAAVCAAVLAHGRAGNLAAERIGSNESVIATDVIAAVPAGLLPEGPVE